MHPRDPVGAQDYVGGGQCIDVTLNIFYLPKFIINIFHLPKYHKNKSCSKYFYEQLLYLQFFLYFHFLLN
jgi:hypothetical protein